MPCGTEVTTIPATRSTAFVVVPAVTEAEAAEVPVTAFATSKIPEVTPPDHSLAPTVTKNGVPPAQVTATEVLVLPIFGIAQT